MDISERRILGFTSIGHFFTHFTMLIFPPLATTIAKDFGTALHDVFQLSFPMYLLYGLSAVPWGYAADRWNTRMVMAVGLALAGVGLIGVGLTRDLTVLGYLLAIVGLGNAAYHPAGLSLISKGLRTRGKGLGFNGIFGNFGIALSPFAAGSLAWWLGWRSTFIIIGIIGIVAALAISLVPFSAPRMMDRQRAKGTEGRQALILFLLLCGGVLFSGLVYRSFTLILPSWLEERIYRYFQSFEKVFASFVDADRGMNIESYFASLITFAVMLIGMGGQLVGGMLADRIDLKWAYGFFFTTAIVCLIAGILIPGWIALLFIGLFTFFLLGIQPIENSLYSLLIPPKWRSSGFGIKFTLGFGVGSFAVRIISYSQPLIGLGSMMYLIMAYLSATVLIALVLNFIGRSTSLRHIHA